MTSLLDLPNEILRIILDLATLSCTIGLPHGPLCGARESLIDEAPGNSENERADLDVDEARRLKFVHRRFSSALNSCLFRKLKIRVKAEDFADGNNGLWKCVSHPSTLEYTESLTLKFWSTSRLPDCEALKARALKDRGITDCLARLRAANFTYARFQALCAIGSLAALLLPQIAVACPALQSVRIAEVSRDPGGKVRERSPEAAAQLRGPGSDLWKQVMEALPGETLTIRQLSVLVLGATPTFELLRHWYIQPRSITIEALGGLWPSYEPGYSEVLAEIGELSDLEELEIYQGERWSKSSTCEISFRRGLFQRQQLARDLCAAWADAGQSVLIQYHILPPEFEEIEDTNDMWEDELGWQDLLALETIWSGQDDP